MNTIGKENPSLRGVLPKRYARRELTPVMLGGLIDTFSRKDLAGAEHQGLDVLGRVYEYFLGKFATAEGKLGGEFYTPRAVVRLLVEMLEPFHGRVFDPACGSGGMFVQAEEFVKAHGGRSQRHLCIRAGAEPDYLAAGKDEPRATRNRSQPRPGVGATHSSTTCMRTCAPTSSSLTNPPFNISEWGGERLRDDPRWRYGDATCWQRQLRLDPAHAPSPVPSGHDGHRPGERVAVITAVRRGGYPPKAH